MSESVPYRPLMAKTTARWLIEYTDLTFEQIAEGCGLHILEIETLSDTSVTSLQPHSPLMTGELTQEEIDRCTQDPEAKLRFQDPLSTVMRHRSRKERRYTPKIRRQDRPDAIAWVLKNYPSMSDYKVCQLLRTTSKTIHAVRNRTHVSIEAIKPRHPVALGLCTQEQLQKVVDALNLPDKEKDSQSPQQNS